MAIKCLSGEFSTMKEMFFSANGRLIDVIWLVTLKGKMVRRHFLLILAFYYQIMGIVSYHYSLIIKVTTKFKILSFKSLDKLSNKGMS